MEKAIPPEAGESHVVPLPPPPYSPTYGTAEEAPPDYEQHQQDASAIADTSGINTF